MMATANIVSIYASADAAGKFELICKNYRVPFNGATNQTHEGQGKMSDASFFEA